MFGIYVHTCTEYNVHTHTHRYLNMYQHPLFHMLIHIYLFQEWISNYEKRIQSSHFKSWGYKLLGYVLS